MARRDLVKIGLLECNVIAAEQSYLECFVDEVEYALHPPPHEKERPTYGCFIANSTMPKAVGKLPVRGISIEHARQLCDGITSFAIFKKGKLARIDLTETNCNEELDLIKLVVEWDGTLIHRDVHGTVQVISDDKIYVHENGTWLLRPHAAASAFEVFEELPGISLGLPLDIADFAFHVLSPRKIGATLVWWHGSKAPPSGAYTSGIDISPAKLRFTNLHYAPLRSLLRLHDGAVMITETGEVRSIEHQLLPSDRAKEIIKVTRGTRHTSGQQFSFDHSEAIVFVISSDGPVSIFSDGALLKEISQSRSVDIQRDLRSLDPHHLADISTDTFFTTCPNCDKRLLVETTRVSGLSDNEKGVCPVCDAVVYTATCWDIQVKLDRKQL